MKTFHPYPYQRRIIDYIIETRRCAVFVSMGLGKTVCSLTAIQSVLGCDGGIRILITAPLKVAQNVWSQEAEKWSHLRELKIVKVLGSAKRREEGLMTAGDIHLMNHDNLTWLWKLIDGGEVEPFDMLVVDESSFFRSPKSQRFRSARKISKLGTRAVILTGTPAPHSVMEMWPQMAIVDDVILGKSYYKFRNTYAVNHGFYYPNWVEKPGAAQKIVDKIGSAAIRYDARDVGLDTVEKVEIDEVVSLSGAARDAYEEMEKEFVIECKESTVAAVNAAVRVNKLQQLASGFGYDEDGNPIDFGEDKLKRLEDLMIDNLGENILVACQYQHNIDRICKRFDAVKLKSAGMVQAWNCGEIPMLVAHPRSAGFGLNLQFGGSLVIWFDLVWSLVDYEQFNARLLRQGQQSTVRIIHLLGEDTIDADILKVLRMRGRNQCKFLEMIVEKMSRL